MSYYEIKNLHFTYPFSENKALDRINLKIEHGEFIAFCGKSGSGKSTLLRHLKTVLTPHGRRTGTVFFHGTKLEDVDRRTQAGRIGYVLQDPDNQIVTDKVWHELAFGLESLGEDKGTIRLRVAEMASYFGIQHWFDKNVADLSGGQKQLLNLASIMAMQPWVLILDEPTAQLDPIAAGDFLETIRKINRELGITVIMTEHRLEEVLPAADRAVVMDQGKIIADGTPAAVGALLKKDAHDMFLAMPAPVQIYAAVDSDLPCPLTVRDGRRWLDALIPENLPTQPAMPKDNFYDPGEIKDVAMECKEVWFRYQQELPDVITGLNLKVPRGVLYSILGGNGTGKSTLLTLISGINRPYRGKIYLHQRELKKYTDKELFDGNIAVLPQDPRHLFVKKTVEQDLLDILGDRPGSQEEKIEKMELAARLTEITELLHRHPYDISGGEQQRAALAKVLLLEPKILLLDEPTKGMDNYFKSKFADILKKLTAAGVTVIMVSHDVEFCGQHADLCALFFNGQVVSTDRPRRFFSGNSFYTTAANRMSRHLFKNAVTNEDVITLCRQYKRPPEPRTESSSRSQVIRLERNMP